MKDATHHLRHVQRKVIQAARKEGNHQGNSEKQVSAPINGKNVLERKVSEAPRRDTRLPGHHRIH